MIDIHNYDLEKEIEKIKVIDKYFYYSPRGSITWYGHEKILRTLYDLEDVSALKAYIYHGVVIEDESWSANDRFITDDYPDFPILTQRKAEAMYQKKRCPKRKNIFYTGALQSMYRRKKNIQLSKDAKGTIVYPVYAAADAVADISWAVYADKLKELPEEFHPINICLFYKEILAGYHEIFLSKGFKVFCAGHRCDLDFCDNQYEIMRHHKYITTNALLGSCLFYGAEMGLRPFIYGLEKEQIYKVKDEKNKKSYEYYNNSTPMKNYIEFSKKNFPIYPNIKLNELQKQNILKILGMDEQSPPDEIRKALLSSHYKTFWHRLFGKYSSIVRKNGTIYRFME